MPRSKDMSQPRALLRELSTKGKEHPVFKARDGAAFNRTNRPIRLLIVARDSVTRRQMMEYLENHHMYATSAAMRQEMLHHLAASKPDLIVLDTRRCQTNGIELLRDVRSASGIPLIVVGRDQPDGTDRVIALDLGADDYITDPIGLRELVARIRAVLRRGEGQRPATLKERRRGACRFAGWQFDRRTMCLTSPAGERVVLTKGEYALLIVFLDAPLRILTRENLLQITRPHEDVFDRSIDARVFRLRRKLEQDAAAPRLIRTERHAGYVFAVPVEYL